jgi:hypothetical protein
VKYYSVIKKHSIIENDSTNVIYQKTPATVYSGLQITRDFMKFISVKLKKNYK